jgi:ferritin
MISGKMQKALNHQINQEFQSAFTYLALSAYFESEELRGCAYWMRIQYEEELMHAAKIYDYIHDRDGEVSLSTVPAPECDPGSPLAAFELALDGEQALTGQIYDLVDLSHDERDHGTHTFLQWFVTEQVEEEDVIRDIVKDLKRIGDSNDGLFMLDRELKQRQPQSTAAPAE